MTQGMEESLICVTHWQGVQRTPREKNTATDTVGTIHSQEDFLCSHPFTSGQYSGTAVGTQTTVQISPMRLTKTQFLQRWDGLRANTTVIRRSLGHLPMEENPF